MIKYFRIALTTALLGAFAVPALAQPTTTQASQPGELVPAAPDTTKPALHAKATKVAARKSHRAEKRHGQVKPIATPSN